MTAILPEKQAFWLDIFPICQGQQAGQDESNGDDEKLLEELTSVEAIKALTLRRIEEHLSESLETLLPGHLLDCSVVGLKFDDTSATLEIKLS